ncbi:MAG: hemolysin family protein [Isosphaeraceae bacterium]
MTFPYFLLAHAGPPEHAISWLDALFVAFLIFVNGFFVAAEFALVKVRTSQVDQLAERGNWAAKLTGRALDRLDTYLSASQLGITVASLALGTAIESQVGPAVAGLLTALGLPSTKLAVGTLSISVVPLLALTLTTFLHMALGEQAPKNLAIQSALRVALWTAPVLVAFTYVFWPLIWLLNAASNLTLRLLGIRMLPGSEVTHTEEEFRHIVAEGLAGGHLSRWERVLIEKVLDLEDKSARRLMVPRPDIVYLSLARPVEENLRLARQAGHTRFPLCEEDLATTIGMIHVKDLFRAGGSGRYDLRKLARKVLILPETLGLHDLLAAFQANKVHLAMLVDEYGDIVGMVTLENVLEQLVGPIQDEFDREDPSILQVGPDVYEVNAGTPLDELAETCNLDIPETEAETTGGLVLDLLGRMARPGDSVRVGDHTLTVLQADPTRVRRVRVEKLPGANGPA